MSIVDADSPADSRAWFRTERKARVLRFIAGGEWVVRDAARLDGLLGSLSLDDAPEAEIDGSAVTRLDSAGALLLLRTKRNMEKAGKRVSSFTLPEVYAPLIDTIEKEHVAPPVVMERRHGPLALLERIGRGTVETGRQGYRMLGYLGRFAIEWAEAMLLPRGNLRFAALIHQVEEVGINALPIVGLLAFLIGIVMAYQGADQLRRFGAEIFTINLLGVGILRELGGLVTAIIIAGRSGSAFTAQIGTMRVNEEIDALQTIGINTFDVLVLPRVLGLLIALPFLTFYADVMAMIGGAVMCYFDLGITFPAFMRQLHEAISMNTFLVGIIKAPVFAIVIGLVGCFEGLQVERNAASVGKLTTRSVVESVFLVIVIDAGFSILFSILKI
ncbi:MAG TPA: ABC transporter permease [Rhizomicrobium sp.]|jgi:phospholipid/cholesterol/gamma-HCH transport system permease protein|nr:ABC transporter permease [Rhizomicrobium sp.]